MRETNFRAWDKHTKEMLYNGSRAKSFYTGQATHRFRSGHEIAVDRIGNCLITHRGILKTVQQEGLIDKIELQSADVEIMQFTGGVDKNEQKIYEGDIVTHTCKSHRDFLYGPFEVRYVTDDSKPFYSWWPLSSYLPSNLIVVGNVYENSELLEGG